MQIYEIGFHIAPFVGDENVAHEVGEIKNALDKIKADIISEDFPRLRPLAYPIDKQIKGDKKICNEAYFGWVKFETSTDLIADFKSEIEKLDNVLRFIILKTVRENTLHGSKFLREKDARKEKKEDDKDEPKQEINEEEIDKSIDELVV